MRRSAYVSACLLGAALALPAYAQQQGRPPGPQQLPQQGGQQMPQQQAPQQYGGYQGQQQGISEERIRAFFNELAQTLDQAAQNPGQGTLVQFLRNHMEPDAVITVANEIYLGNTLVAQTMAQVPEDTLSDALGVSSPAIHGRKLMQDYNVDFRIRDIRPVPGANMARVFATVSESGRFMVGEAAQRLAGIRQRFAEMGMGGGRQMGGMGMGMGGGRQMGGMGMGGGGPIGGMPSQMQQSPSQGQIPGQGQMTTQPGQMQGPYQGQAQAGNPQLPPGVPEALRFQATANCIFDVVQEGNDIKIGNTFCRGESRLS